MICFHRDLLLEIAILLMDFCNRLCVVPILADSALVIENRVDKLLSFDALNGLHSHLLFVASLHSTWYNVGG